MESMVCSDRKSLANAVGGKSARACDNCIKRRAGWYCAADDAFLCQSCDSSVHSANPLARRHERVRLKTSSSVIKSSSSSSEGDDESRVPTWHQGFTRKARTPRHKKRPSVASFNNCCEAPVPEINCSDEDEQQLLYRVPVFDPFVSSSRSESKPAMSMSHFLPTEMDLAEFAADVESLLGNGLDNEAAFDMEGLGILGDCDEKGSSSSMRVVKVEDEVNINNNNHQFEGEFIDMGRESFVLNFDYDDSPVLGELEDTKINNNNNNNNNNDSRKILLRLDYEGVMSAWDDHKSPWTTGERPDSSDCWPDNCAGSKLVMHGYGGMMSTHTHTHGSSTTVMADGGREARVSRYREKRRTRLFSKKIRYEVRKLNAEKRPRMKGRFVKRPHFATTTTAS